MSLVNWISSNPDATLAIASTVGAWLYSKARGKKTDDLWETLLKLGRQVVPRLLADARLYDDAYVRSEIRRALLAGLARLKVTENKMTLALVDEVVEHVHGELAEKLTEYHLSEFIKVQSKTVELLK